MNNIITPSTPLLELNKNLPFIDPDSTRMLEWIWNIRQLAGLSTHANEIIISSTTKVTFSTLCEELKGHVQEYYQSSELFRAIVVTDTVVDRYVVLEKLKDDYRLNIFGDKDFVKLTTEHFTTTYKEPDSVNVTQLLGFSQAGPEIQKSTLIENEQELACDALYPWLNEGIDAFVENYLRSKSSVLILLGLPGTGKSTFLRTLLFKLGRANNGLCNNEEALLHPELMSWIRNFDKDAAIGIEDADRLVASREAGNKQMSALLNFTDGVVATTTKVIISTNLSSIDKIDEALLRPGRTYKILKFRKLSNAEANDARAALDLPPIDFDTYDEHTLSEVLNWREGSEMKQHRHTGMGFSAQR